MEGLAAQAETGGPAGTAVALGAAAPAALEGREATAVREATAAMEGLAAQVERVEPEGTQTGERSSTLQQSQRVDLHSGTSAVPIQSRQGAAASLAAEVLGQPVVVRAAPAVAEEVGPLVGAEGSAVTEGVRRVPGLAEQGEHRARAA